MKNAYQKTISTQASTSGLGLHSGLECSVQISPREPNFGLKFVSKQDPLKREIPVTEQTLDGGQLGTNIIFEDVTIRTVEHLLSAVVSLGLSNALITVDGGEIPIKDGSAKDFIDLIESGGLITQDEVKSKQALPTSIAMNFEQGKHIAITPLSDTDEVVISMEIDFDNEVTKGLPASLRYTHNTDNFVDHVGLARTFGFKRDIDALLDMGLVLGGSLSNAILIGESKILNKEGLRFNDELVAHKILDIIGDFYPLLDNYYGFEINAHKAGHYVNNKTLKGIMSKLKDIAGNKEKDQAI